MSDGKNNSVFGASGLALPTSTYVPSLLSASRKSENSIDMGVYSIKIVSQPSIDVQNFTVFQSPLDEDFLRHVDRNALLIETDHIDNIIGQLNRLKKTGQPVNYVRSVGIIEDDVPLTERSEEILEGLSFNELVPKTNSSSLRKFEIAEIGAFSIALFSGLVTPMLFGNLPLVHPVIAGICIINGIAFVAMGRLDKKLHQK